MQQPEVCAATVHGGLYPVFTSGRSVAGGLMLYEIATDNVGLANAGAAARAQGPSTIASNPAGLSYLSGTQICAGAQVLFGDLSFDKDSETNTPGTDSGNALNPIPGGSFFISHQLDTQWSILATVNWQDWSKFGDIGIDVDTSRTGSHGR